MTSISIQYAWEYLYLNSKHLSFHFLKQHEIKFSLTPRVSPSFLLDLPPFEHLGLAVRITTQAPEVLKTESEDNLEAAMLGC